MHLTNQIPTHKNHTKNPTKTTKAEAFFFFLAMYLCSVTLYSTIAQFLVYATPSQGMAQVCVCFLFGVLMVVVSVRRTACCALFKCTPSFA